MEPAIKLKHIDNLKAYAIANWSIFPQVIDNLKAYAIELSIL